MLEKIVSIKNVGRFVNYGAAGDVTFRNLTLLFTENGRGKTTLCAILRSLQSGHHEHISERETLGGSEAPSILIRIDGGTISYSDRRWSAVYKDISIFDSTFIHDNVYSGDYVEHEHKKNLYRVIIGAQGVQLARQVDSLNEKIRSANSDLRSKKETVLRLIPDGIALDEYLSWEAVSEIDILIKNKKEEIDSMRRAIESAEEIQKEGILSKLQLPSFPPDFTNIISKQLSDIEENAEAFVHKQIANHEMGNQGEAWLSRGLGYIKNDLCPFCGQSVKTNELIAAYRSHFNADYIALKEEIAQLSQHINNRIGLAALNTAQQTYSNNLALQEFWKQFLKLSLEKINFDEIQAKYSKLREMVLSIALLKQQSPLGKVSPDTDFMEALNAVQALQNDVAAYNNGVDDFNAIVNKQKSNVQEGGNVRVLEADLVKLEAKKQRLEPEVVKACQDYESAIDDKAQLEQLKTRAKEQLDQYCETNIQLYEQIINEYLEQFNTGFRIINTKYQYTGGTPISQFQIVINSCPVDLGNQKTPAGKPCFRTTLSSGD